MTTTQPDFDTNPDTSQRVYLSYIDRTRKFYLKQGFDNPYRWAHHNDSPFTALRKPLSESRLGLVTTAAEYNPDLGDQGPQAAYNNDAKFDRVYTRPSDSLPDLRVSHIGYDRQNARVDDLAAYFPLARLQESVAAGRIGELSPRFYAVPTLRSQRATSERDAPEILELMRADKVDVALLVAV